MDENRDPLDRIDEGVRAAMALSFERLKRLGYSREIAKAELLRITRQAVTQLADKRS